MEAERKRVANEQRSIGAAESEKIRADADRQREVLLAEAYRDAQKIKGEGDAKASAIYAQAFGQNPEFAQFYRSLEAYRTTFDKRSDVLVVDKSADFFRFMNGAAAAVAAGSRRRSADVDHARPGLRPDARPRGRPAARGARLVAADVQSCD